METIRPAIIKKYCIETFGYDFDNNDRKRESVYFRAVYFTLIKELTNLTVEKIGRSLNHVKNHATVLHAFKVFENQIIPYEKDIHTQYKYIKFFFSNLNAPKIVVKDVDLINDSVVF